MKTSIKKKATRMAAGVLTAVMSIPAIAVAKTPVLLRADAADYFIKNADNTVLGTKGIGSPRVPESIDDYWSGSYVYFGTSSDYGPIKYRVLDPDTDRFTEESGERTMFIDCDTGLYKDKYLGGSGQSISSGVVTNLGWEYSNLRERLHGYGFLTCSTNRFSFYQAEKDAMADSYLTTTDDEDTLFEETYDKVFVIDNNDISNLDYGYFPAHHNKAVKSRIKYQYGTDQGGIGYWTRTVDEESTVYAVINTGQMIGPYGYDDTYYVAPAMNIKLDSILFSTCVKDPDSDGYGGEYKLTFKENRFSIGLPSDGVVTQDEDTFTVPYVIDRPGNFSANAVTLLITDKPYTNSEANILCYDLLVSSESKTGTATFTLPSGLDRSGWGVDYHVYILAEKIWDAGKVEWMKNRSDLASAPFELPCPSGVGITINMEDHAFWDITPRISDALDTLIISDLVDEKWVNTYNTELDIDRDGNYDIRRDSLNEVMWVMTTSSCKGLYTFNKSQLDEGFSDFEYIKLRFPSTNNKTVFTKAEPSDTGVQLKWSPVGTYKRFNVYRSDSLNGTYSYIASVTDGSNKYVDKTAQGGKTYYYKVRPYTKTDGVTSYGPWSDGKKVTILSDLKLTVAPKSGVTMTLSWSVVSGASSYEIYRATSANGPYTYVKATTGTTTSDTGLHAGTRYYYMVRATKTVNGEKQYSKYASGVAVALATPTLESAKYTSGKGVTLTWTKASGADRFNVYRYNGTGYEYVASVLGGTLTYTDPNGKKGDYYKVRAYKRVDGVVYYGGWSNAKAAK